jgi:hypothetical protein
MRCSSSSSISGWSAVRHDPRRVVAATALVTVFRVSTKAFGLRRSAALAVRLAGRDRPPTSARARPVDPVSVVRTVRAVATRLPIGALCLPRSLAAWTILRRAGVPAVLRIGMQTDGTVEAHAWVEVDGEPVDELLDITTIAPFTLDRHLPAVLVGAAS